MRNILTFFFSSGEMSAMHAKQTSDQISIFLQAVQLTTDTMIFSSFLGLPFVHALFNQRLPHFELIFLQ